MRRVLSDTMQKLASENNKIVFITGDLGYNALENLQKAMGERFINAGVAEQNMVGMAAGLAYKGYHVFCYSIAPFIVYRCLEQFRNDVCFHNLPVCIIGNGGGYGYGIMGSSHHALEDIACLSSMPDNTCYIPAFNNDVPPILSEIIKRKKPAYLRLGLGKNGPEEIVTTGSFTKRISSKSPKATVFSSGPVTNLILEAISDPGLIDAFDLFTFHQLPFEISGLALASLKATKNLVVVEEHRLEGGFAEKVSLKILTENIPVNKVNCLYAKGYPDNLYGNQNFHLGKSGLDKESMVTSLKAFIQ